jgi:ribosomal protein S18 acetylase RimI-like enzyme
MDAAARALRAEQANFTLLVDAKDETAAAFYRHHGFTAFASDPHILFLPLATAAKLLRPSR